jgi:RNA polymerase sigma factor (sigma-70 family)
MKPLSPAQQELVTEHLDLVDKIARRYQKRAVRDLDELTGEGSLALCEAARRHKPGSGDFRAYATVWIAAYMASAASREWEQPRTNAEGLEDCPAEDDGSLADLEEIRAVIGRLSDDERKLLAGYFATLFDQPESVRDIARQTGRSKSSVHRDRQKALSKVRQACA